VEQKTYTLTYSDADDLMQKARNLMYRAYMETIDSYGEEIKENAIAKIKEGDDRDDIEEWMSDEIHETIDNSQWVIYTYKAKMALLVSDNEDAMEDETGETGTTEQRAYYAMVADLRAWFDRNMDLDDLIEEHAPKTDEEDEEDSKEETGTAN